MVGPANKQQHAERYMRDLSRGAKAANGEDPDKRPAVIAGVVCCCCGEPARKNCSIQNQPACDECALSAIASGFLYITESTPIEKWPPCPKHRKNAELGPRSYRRGRRASLAPGGIHRLRRSRSCWRA